MRFNAGQSGATAVVDPVQILADVEADKQKKLDRAAKFGVTIVEDHFGDKTKKAERLQRFGGADAAITSNAPLTDEQKARIQERKARFGNQNVAEKVKADIASGNLEFTLDDYKSKQAKVFGKDRKGGDRKHKKGKTLRGANSDKHQKKNGFKNKDGPNKS